MISEYLKGYIDALCYPIYRGARKAGCVEVPADHVEEASARIRRIGCIAVVGREVQPGVFEVWAVRNHSVRRELEELLAQGDDSPEYHEAVGRLLGYSEDHIRIFLETQRPTV